jgi:hypothetical protein
MTALAKREAGAIAQQEGNAVLSMIERAARDPAVDIEKMRQLLQMRADEEARCQARISTRLWRRCSRKPMRLPPTATTRRPAANTLPISRLDRALRPIYTKHGFALSFDTEPERRA